MGQNEFGLQIRTLRKQAGLNQRQLAERIGVDFSYLSKIENGVIPPPSEEVILKLAEALNTDKDELMASAGKVPSDIVQILKNKDILSSLREGSSSNKNAGTTDSSDSFSTRLRKLREGTGLSQAELAKRVGVSFTYLSKLENGVKPPPSQKIILKLAEALKCDKDELLTLAGKLPPDITRILRNQEILQSLREQRSQKHETSIPNNNGRGIGIMRYFKNSKMVLRTALAILLVCAVAASLWYASPAPVQALQVAITNPSGQPLEAGILGESYQFQVTVTIEDGELLPIQGIDLDIFKSDNTSYKASLTSLPLTDGATANYTDGQTGGGSVNVAASAPDLSSRYRYGYGYAVWQGYGYNYPQGYGYGYQYGATTITYNITWVPPSGWPAGNYQIETRINTGSRTFTQQSTAFALSSGVTLQAETSVNQTLSRVTTDVVVVNVNINRIKNTSDNSTANITGGIGSYNATASGIPGNSIQFITVHGVSPFDGPTFNATTGVFAVASVGSPIQASNTTIAEVVAILTGNVTTSVNLTVSFQDIIAAGNPSLNVPEEQASSIIFLRGDTDGNGAVDIGDASWIAQYVVGMRALSQLNGLNAASVSHDGASGDKIDIGDASWIAQYVVGMRDGYFD